MSKAKSKSPETRGKSPKAKKRVTITDLASKPARDEAGRGGAEPTSDHLRIITL